MSATYYAKVSPVQPNDPLKLVIEGVGEAVLNNWWEIEVLTPPCNGTPTRCRMFGRWEAIQDAVDCAASWEIARVKVELIIPVVMSDFFPEDRPSWLIESGRPS